MSRQTIFEREAIEGISGLTSLTEPASDERVSAIVDIAVMGARGDGKTQFIVHAIRTLRAYAPPLSGTERRFHRDILEVVMDAREPRPEATVPGVVPHYVFRIRPDSLLAQVGLVARLGLLVQMAGLAWSGLVAGLNALLLGLLLWGLRGGLDAYVAAGAGLALAVGVGLGWLLARRRFHARGPIEIVFWDVAGEHVYSTSAADYHGFLGALVERRRARATEHARQSPAPLRHGRAYAFAPVLLCNPIGLGARMQGSPFTRLRQLMPMFASLNEPLPHALVAINRWSAVEALCRPDSDRDELVAVVSRPRDQADPSADTSQPAAPSPATPSTATTDLPPLPVVRREVVRAHCLDPEDGRHDDVRVTYLRYDAGMQCELASQPWPGPDGLDDDVGAHWSPPRGPAPACLLAYEYEDGPGAFEGHVRAGFLRWIATLACHRHAYEPVRAAARLAGALGEPAFASDRGPDSARPSRAEWGRGRATKPKSAASKSAAPKPAAPKPTRPRLRSAPALSEAEAGPRPLAARADSAPPATREDSAPLAKGADDASPASRPDSAPPATDTDEAPLAARAMSASGLEDFSRSALANAIDTSPADDPASDRIGDPMADPMDNHDEPGLQATAHAADEPAEHVEVALTGASLSPTESELADAATRRDKKSDTLPLSGGFGTSGT